MHKVVGSCSLCGGPVMMPESWHSSIPPKPTCMKCGAKKKENLPVIEMVREQAQELLLS